MTASILAQAIHLTFVDLVVGGGIAVVLALLLWLVASAQKDLPQRERPEPVEPWYPAEEIRVHDLTRRGPTPIEHSGKTNVGA